MVEDLEEMMVERLEAFEKKSGKLPQRVFIFRDGVSEVRSLLVLREISFETLIRDNLISR